jgi:hypothetical protein
MPCQFSCRRKSCDVSQSPKVWAELHVAARSPKSTQVCVVVHMAGVRPRNHTTLFPSTTSHRRLQYRFMGDGRKPGGTTLYAGSSVRSPRPRLRRPSIIMMGECCIYSSVSRVFPRVPSLLRQHATRFDFCLSSPPPLFLISKRLSCCT